MPEYGWPGPGARSDIAGGWDRVGGCVMAVGNEQAVEETFHPSRMHVLMFVAWTVLVVMTRLVSMVVVSMSLVAGRGCIAVVAVLGGPRTTRI